MSCEPEVILDNYYGSHQPAVFCENFRQALANQGLDEEAQIIVDADRAASVLYDDPDLSAEAFADLLEQAVWAWETILERFIPEEGYHLGYMPDDQALWMIPNDWHDPDYD